MTILLDLEPELEAHVAARAQELGVPVPQYLQGLIARSVAGMPDTGMPEIASGWPLGFLDNTYGALASDPLTRPPQGDAETREPFT